MSVDLLNAAEPDATLAPDAAVFATRAARFAQLANGHALGPWLAFLGQLSLAQSQLRALPPAPPASATQPLWPATAASLGNAVDRAAPLLRQQGLVIERHKSGSRYLSIAHASGT